MLKKQKSISKSSALKKLEFFCAYRERSYKEVLAKLNTFELSEKEKQEIIDTLVENNFISENRFASSFVRGKLNIKKWGRIKIAMRLRAEQISEKAIEQAFQHIEKDHYIKTLQSLINKKLKTIKVKDKSELKYKLSAFAIQKGYESDLVWKVINEMKW